MDIIVNGEPTSLHEGHTAEDLIRVLGLEGQRVAMEINGDVQPRSGYAQRRLQPGDRVEIVRAIGGG